MPATTTWGVQLRVEFAIARPADAGRWGSSLWKVAAWGDSDTPTGDWVDVTCELLDSLRLTAGSNTEDGVTRRWESATASFTLKGPQWDPWGGPHAEVLGDRTPVRIWWRYTGAPTWVAAFTGFIATRGYNWRPDDQEADVACIDGTSILVAAHSPPRPLAGVGETAADRVTRIATAALWPAPLDVTAGGSPLQGSTLAAPAWDELLAVADTDLALMWVRRDGSLAFRPRGRVLIPAAPSGRIAVCESPGDVPAITLGLTQPSITRNRVSISRKKDDTIPGDVPAVATLVDQGSITRFQSHDYARLDLWHTADTWSATIAQAVLGSGAWPSKAPGELLLDVAVDDPQVAAVLLGAEPDQTYDVVDLAGTVWREAVVGWDVQVSNGQCSGLLHMEDVTRWAFAAHWGSSIWGVDLWGIGSV